VDVVIGERDLETGVFTEFDLDCQNCTLSSAILIRKSE
jgi:hypothetical protein